MAWNPFDEATKVAVDSFGIMRSFAPGGEAARWGDAARTAALIHPGYGTYKIAKSYMNSRDSGQSPTTASTRPAPTRVIEGSGPRLRSGDFYRGLYPSSNRENPYDRYVADARLAGNQNVERIDSRLASLDSDYTARRQALMGLFNTGEDRGARQLRDWVLQELVNQEQGAGGAIRNSYGTGITETEAIARELEAMGRTAGAENAALYNQAAGNVEGFGESLGAAGGGPAGSYSVGSTNDLAALLSAGGVREQALAQTLGAIDAQSQMAAAQSLGSQRDAAMGQLAREAMGMRAGVVSQYGQQEAARRQAERNASIQAQLALESELFGERRGLQGQRDQAMSQLDNALLEAGLQGRLLQDDRDSRFDEEAYEFNREESMRRGVQVWETQVVNRLRENGFGDQATTVALALKQARMNPGEAHQIVGALYQIPEVVAAISRFPQFPQNSADALASLGLLT
jgi:hypothetical protein